MKPERVRVLGIPVDAVTMSGAIEYVDHLVRGGPKGHYVLAVNPEKIAVLQKDTLLKEMFEEASLLLPDGIGVVLAVRLLFGNKIDRVPGADLMQRICGLAAEKNYRVFIFGSEEEVNRKAVEALTNRFPGLKITGRRNGYIKDTEMKELAAEINASGADILFVALGSPRQEKWIRQYLPELNVKVCQGIGGTLDTLAGNVKRAPVFFQRLGLEWFYRLLREPRRIRRQAVLPIFALKVLREKIRPVD